LDRQVAGGINANRSDLDVIPHLGNASDRGCASGGDVVVVGEFDGFHCGHRTLLRRAVAVAAALECPLRCVVLDSRRRLNHLMPVGWRVERVLAAGAASCEVLAVEGGLFDNEVVAREVVERHRPVLVVVACPPDFQPGGSSLETEFRSIGVGVVPVERCHRRGSVVTSDSVRAALDVGDIEMVNDLVGATLLIRGEVVRGAQLGRTIGFPTANLDPPIGRHLPAAGVYAGAATTESRNVWDAAINIGTSPSVGGSNKLLIEAHLIGFEGDLYGQQIQIGGCCMNW